MEFEHYRSNMTFLGLYSNLLSTDARCLVNILGGSAIGSILHEAASRGPSALDILVKMVAVWFPGLDGRISGESSKSTWRFFHYAIYGCNSALILKL